MNKRVIKTTGAKKSLMKCPLQSTSPGLVKWLKDAIETEAKPGGSCEFAVFHREAVRGLVDSVPLCKQQVR